MVDVLLLGLAMLTALALAYCLGKHFRDENLMRENLVLKRVQRNLNALVLDQRHQIQAVDGLWATDQPELIKHHAKRERFFRIGHPEERL